MVIVVLSLKVPISTIRLTTDCFKISNPPHNNVFGGGDGA